MKIQYKNIDTLIHLLSPIKLDVKEALSRRRFLKLFRDSKEDKDEIVSSLREKYIITENEKFKIIDKQYQFKTPAGKKKFIQEARELDDTEVEIDLSKNEEDQNTCIKLLENHRDETIKQYENKMTENEYLYIEMLDEIITIINKK